MLFALPRIYTEAAREHGSLTWHHRRAEHDNGKQIFPLSTIERSDPMGKS
jgi:hypothetical protein